MVWCLVTGVGGTDAWFSRECGLRRTVRRPIGYSIRFPIIHLYDGSAFRIRCFDKRRGSARAKRIARPSKVRTEPRK